MGASIDRNRCARKSDTEAVRRDILDEHNAFQDREALLHTANGTLPCVLSFAP